MIKEKHVCVTDGPKKIIQKFSSTINVWSMSCTALKWDFNIKDKISLESCYLNKICGGGWKN